MLRRLLSLVACLSPLLLGVAQPASTPVLQLVPLAIEAPDSQASASGIAPACTTPFPFHPSTFIHCYTPAQIRAAYAISSLGDPTTGTGNLGQGQTIVLVDAYGSPTAQTDLQFFHNAFFPNLPAPNFSQVFPQGQPDFTNGCGPNGFSAGPSGPCAAAGWSGEATLDIEWSYAIAPLAHIVLLAVPPAETEGVQGFPNLFNAIQGAIDAYPAGTIFSQSFGVTEQTFHNAGTTITAMFDRVYQAAAAKGDTVLASSGDNGTTGVANLLGTKFYSFPTTGWPASSPFVTAVGGTQLQYGWTWNPTSDKPFSDFPTNHVQNPSYFAYTNSGSSEAVWNESWLPAASGGGPSAIYARPSWQSTVAGVTGDHRGVPDLAWNAAVNGGVLVYITAFPFAQRAGWHVYGGTSAGSPQMAGVAALVNKGRSDAHKGPIGFLSPYLYSLSAADFSDIVPHTYGTAASGVLHDNELWAYQADGSVAPNGIAGHPTTTGYDMTTGLGRPVVANFVADLVAEP